MKISVIGNSEKCSEAYFKRVCKALGEHFEIVAKSFAPNTVLPQAVNDDVEGAVVFGGDGTIISVCHAFCWKPVPIVGVNFGKIGYLANFYSRDFDDIITRNDLSTLFASTHFSQRMALRIDPSTLTETAMAVNDCVIDIGPPFRTITLEIRINGNPLPFIRGDGVIISTPTGSTASNMSAEGPIIEPSLASVIINPKNPHRLSFRPLVVSPDARIDVRLIEAEGAYMIIDGQKATALKGDEELLITRWTEPIKIAESMSYWDTLTKKLSWGS